MQKEEEEEEGQGLKIGEKWSEANKEKQFQTVSKFNLVKTSLYWSYGENRKIGIEWL